MVIRHPTPSDSYKFSTGNYIRSGRLIDPNSSEGKTIEDILKRQRKTRVECKTKRKISKDYNC